MYAYDGERCPTCAGLVGTPAFDGSGRPRCPSCACLLGNSADDVAEVVPSSCPGCGEGELKVVTGPRGQEVVCSAECGYKPSGTEATVVRTGRCPVSICRKPFRIDEAVRDAEGGLHCPHCNKLIRRTRTAHEEGGGAMIAEEVVGSEHDQVVEWRKEELQRAGYSAHSAELLAERLDVDLHRAIELLKSGCPEETALRILL